MEHIYQQQQFGESWFNYPDFYKSIVEKFDSGSTFVEVGSWKGKSSAFMAVEIINSKKDIKFYCVDTWEGGVDHIGYDCLPHLYNIFIENMKPLEGHYTPLRMTSLKAAEKFEDHSLDFVYIDASHEYEDVIDDIKYWMPKVKPGGTIAGHDYANFFGVTRAVDELVPDAGVDLNTSVWYYEIPKEEKRISVVQVGSNKGSDDLYRHLVSTNTKLDFCLLVEANPEHIQELTDCYKDFDNVIVKNIAIKTPNQIEDKLTIFYDTNSPGLEVASCDINHVLKHQHCWPGGEIKSFDISAITLQDLLDSYNVKTLDWLLLDVEGIDADVVETFNWSKYKIQRVEFEYIHLEERAPKIYQMFIDMGYEQVSSLHQYDWAFELKDNSTQNVENNSTINVLFSANSKEEIWETDYILDDILPSNTSCDFVSPQSISRVTKNYDVFVYNCRLHSYNEILSVVKKIKPKIIVHLSDEYHFENLSEYNNLAKYCNLFLRQHHHPGFVYDKNVIQIPLGYCNDAGLKNKSIPKISDRFLNWSFVGDVKHDRFEMIQKFKTIENNFSGCYIDKEKMMRIYLNSIFVPNGRGNSSLNCFRLYEASMAGCIPVVVSSEEERELTFKYEENPPWIFSDSWDNAVAICSSLLNNKEELQRIQNNIISWWKNRISKIKKAVEENLYSNEYKTSTIIPENQDKLKNFPPINFISITESDKRRQNLYKMFEEYKLGNITPHIFEKYKDSDHKITGAHVDILAPIPHRGPVTSHIKAIKEWYLNTNEPYAFFCEDDISFETVKYWNFTWNEFFRQLPSSWECVQLCVMTDSFDLNYTHIKNVLQHKNLRTRDWCDWSCCAYLIRREHAKKIVENYYPDDTIILEYKGWDVSKRTMEWNIRPTPETMVYSYFVENTDTVFSFPLFVESDAYTSTWTTEDYKNKESSHNVSKELVVKWWEETGKDLDVQTIMNYKNN